MRTLTSRLLLGIIASAAAGAGVTLAAAPAQAEPTTCPVATSGDFSTYFNAAMPSLLADHQIPGAVVSVVSGGETAFAQGYGVADIERGIPFDAAQSLVHVGSVTKLFTWTAVMQLVEAGRLDLHADVNTYLTGFQIPATYAQPVTLLDLMDHTSGFEDYSIASYGRTASDVVPLGDYLARHVPARVRPPGQITAYSNYGAGLAGYIVAEVSGEPYDQYIEDHILRPLGMTRSTVAQPLPAGLAEDLAQSYDSYVSPAQPIPYMFDQLPPDGALSTTALDMASFMNAHLHGGGAILRPETTKEAHERSFAADPRLDGYAHGFKERTINGHRVLMHDGGEEGFRSVAMLVPDCDLGLFLSMNGTSAEEAAGDFTDGFFSRFAPPVPGVTSTSGTAGPLAVAAPQAGFYLTTRHNESTVEKVANLLSAVRVTVADGTVHFGGKDWTAQDDGTYQTVDGNRLVFLVSPDGHRYIATDGSAYVLVPSADTLPFNLVVLLVIIVPSVSVLVLLVVWLVRRLTRRAVGSGRPAWRAARWLAVASALLMLTFVVALFLVLIGNTDEFLYHVPLSFRLLLALPLLALATGVASVVLTITGWRGTGLAARVHQIALFVGLLAFAWFVWHWNLIGWQYA